MSRREPPRPKAPVPRRDRLRLLAAAGVLLAMMALGAGLVVLLV